MESLQMSQQGKEHAAVLTECAPASNCISKRAGELPNFVSVYCSFSVSFFLLPSLPLEEEILKYPTPIEKINCLYLISHSKAWNNLISLWFGKSPFDHSPLRKKKGISFDWIDEQELLPITRATFALINPEISSPWSFNKPFRRWCGSDGEDSPSVLFIISSRWHSLIGYSRQMGEFCYNKPLVVRSKWEKKGTVHKTTCLNWGEKVLYNFYENRWVWSHTERVEVEPHRSITSILQVDLEDFPHNSFTSGCSEVP